MSSHHRTLHHPPHASSAQDDVSPEELKRQRRRRQLARKTPEQRRKSLQYSRRHNEQDGRLFYCDYCDLFISSAQRVWRRHLVSAKHMGNVEAYWRMAAHVEAPWLNEMHESIAKAQVQHLHRQQQAVAGRGAATPLPPMRVGVGIVVGGLPPSHGVATPAGAAAGAAAAVPPGAIQIKVGDTVLPSPLAKAARTENAS